MKNSEIFALLVKQATAALDLSLENLFSKSRVDAMYTKKGIFQLFYAFERLDAKTEELLFSYASEQNVLEKMKDMFEGEKVNRSQNRAALHTACRDIFEKKIASKPEANRVRSFAEEELKKLKNFCTVMNQYDTLVQIGIGGSALGPKALYEALFAYSKPKKRLHFISNVDPDPITKLLKEIDLAKTLFVTVSKSGSTPETKVNDQIIRNQLLKANLIPEKQMVVITEKNSNLDKPHLFCERFYIDPTVGGRFSSTSMVGGVCLAFALGLDNFLEILRGAHECDFWALDENMQKNIPLLLALFSLWNTTFLKIPCLAVLPYDTALESFVDHLAQLCMESNGKSKTLEGKKVDYLTSYVLFGGVGTDYQHSFGQLLHQGTQPVAMEFLASITPEAKEEFLVEGTTSKQKSLANLFAQAYALATGDQKEFLGNHPSHILLFDHSNPRSMGQLLSIYEHKAAFEGFLWGINSFDQPGVELGKKLAEENLSVIAKKNISTPLQEKMLQLFRIH